MASRHVVTCDGQVCSAYPGPFTSRSFNNIDDQHAPCIRVQVINCLMWTWYGVSISDMAQAVTNGIGLALGVTQLVLLMVFRNDHSPVPVSDQTL